MDREKFKLKGLPRSLCFSSDKTKIVVGEFSFTIDVFTYGYYEDSGQPFLQHYCKFNYLPST